MEPLLDFGCRRDFGGYHRIPVTPATDVLKDLDAGRPTAAPEGTIERERIRIIM
jgi:hypothetical protein